MKIVLTSFLLCSYLIIYSQETLPTNESGNVIYSEVVTLDNSESSANLYIKALTWFNNYYQSGKSVIQMQDKEAGIIIGKGSFRCNLYTMVPNKGLLSYTITVSCKEGKYKYDITNLIWQSSTNSLSYNAEEFLPDSKLARNNKKMARKTIEEINENMKILTTNLKSSLAKKENW